MYGMPYLDWPIKTSGSLVLNPTVLQVCVFSQRWLLLRVREISMSVYFVAFYFTAHDRKLRKVPREFFKL
jgi:hypothetical protein